MLMEYFYIFSKVFWFVISPDNFLILLVVIASVLISTKWSVKWGTRILISSTFCLVTILFLPVADIILRPLEQRFERVQTLPENIEGVIVLGGAERGELGIEWGSAQFNQAAERLMVLPVLAQQYPQAKLIFTGGSGSLLHPQAVADSAMTQWFVDNQIADRVLWEKGSRNTFENALLSEQALAGVPTGKWLLVTSAFHMPRSMGVFRQRGWDVMAYPVDYYSITANGMRVDPKYWQHVRDLNFSLKEWIGLVVYYYTNKTNALFPAP
jgi:uncharacterized SAM-binding protein YcdF (DUF218 family)